MIDDNHFKTNSFSSQGLQKQMYDQDVYVLGDFTNQYYSSLLEKKLIQNPGNHKSFRSNSLTNNVR